MNATTIIYPSIVMFALTLSMILYMGFHRYRAIHAGDVSIKYFRTYNEGDQTNRLHLLSRHVQNHFEVPPLLHLGVLLTYVTDSVTLAAVIFAWLFVVGRCVHSAIHLGGNNVSLRFFTFGGTLACLLGLWAALTYSLLTAA